MARKEKKSDPRLQPNAPEFSQVLSQQPAHNPYYPNLPSSRSHLLPPPAYSELSTPLSSDTANSRHYHQSASMAQVNSAGSTGVNYSRYQDHPTGASVVIQQVPYNHREERYNRKVRSFNSRLLLIAIIAAVSSVWAYSLYKERPCVFDFTVHKPNKDLKISISTVRDMHLTVASASGLIVLLCVVKSAMGFRGKSHSCYLFLIGVLTFFVTLFTGYLAYLSFYSPCALKVNELFSNLLKTSLGSLTDSLPAPERGVFGESNVIQVANEDRRGVAIFAIDLSNFAFYFAAFLTSTLLC